MALIVDDVASAVQLKVAAVQLPYLFERVNMLVDFEKHVLQHILGGSFVGNAPLDELLQGQVKCFPKLLCCGQHVYTSSIDGVSSC
jgi:hypothetical protein